MVSILLVSLVKVAVLLFFVLTAVAYLVWFERKLAAHLQGRWGPYRVGPHGLLQPLADGAKFLLKEDVTPAGVDRFVYYARSAADHDPGDFRHRHDSLWASERSGFLA